MMAYIIPKKVRIHLSKGERNSYKHDPAPHNITLLQPARENHLKELNSQQKRFCDIFSSKNMQEGFLFCKEKKKAREMYNDM
jgi:hypothetical protein